MKQSLASFSLTKTPLQAIHFQICSKTLLICCSTKITLFFNWMVHLFILLTISVPVFMWISQVDGKKEKEKWHGPLVLLLLCLWTFFSGAISKTRCAAKEWIRWTNSKHRSVQQLQTLQQSCYSVSGKMWTIDETYTELQMALTANHFAYSNFSTSV